MALLLPHPLVEQKSLNEKKNKIFTNKYKKNLGKSIKFTKEII